MPGVYRRRVCVDCGNAKRVKLTRGADAPPLRCQRCNGLSNAAHLPPTAPRTANASTDHVAVQRLVQGAPPPYTTPTERILAARMIMAAEPGLSAAGLARRLGVSTRTAIRYRSEIRREDRRLTTQDIMP